MNLENVPAAEPNGSLKLDKIETDKARSQPSSFAERSANFQLIVRQLESSNPPELRACWRETFKSPSPDISPSLMRHAIANRLQEHRHGKLAASQLRQIAKLQKKLASNGTLAAATSTKLPPGTQLIRKWNEGTHVVLVHDTGYEYNGKRFRSLTQIAQFITGAHWSGPRFFGLKRPTLKPSPDA